MNETIGKLIDTDLLDPGCEASAAVLHRYVERELSGGDAASQMPEEASHLRSCDACRYDFESLIAVARDLGGAAPTDH
jgi:hypothetical protein